MFEKYVIANYRRLPRVIVKGEGNYLFDADGNKILDMFPGWAVSGIGHCHPKVVEAIRKQAGELLHIDNTFYTEQQGQLAQLLSERAFGGKCFFCNSGAEANEAALKLARRHTAKGKVQIHHRRRQFSRPDLRDGNGDGTAQVSRGLSADAAGFSYVPFNDIDALEAAFTDEVAAVMVEPIQGEGGINVATTEYLQAIRQLVR